MVVRMRTLALGQASNIQASGKRKGPVECMYKSKKYMREIIWYPNRLPLLGVYQARIILICQ